MNRKIEEILKEIGGEDVPAEVHKIAEETSGKFSKTLMQSRKIVLWENILRSPITKVAAAAVIIIAVLVGIYQFGGSIDGTSAVFADVLEEIYNARTVTYKETFYPGTEREFTTEDMIIESGIVRSVMADGGVTIFDFNGGRELELQPASRKAILTHRVGRKRGKRLFNYLTWVKSLHEKSGQYIGGEEINGEMTDVFLVDEEFTKKTIWVDPETNLPVRVRVLHLANPDNAVLMPKMRLEFRDFGGDTDESMTISISTGSGGIQEEMTTVMHDFVWDADIDETLFNLEPPEGYKVEEKQLDVTNRGENGLIGALSFWAEMSDGAFPLVINDLGDPNKVRPLLIDKFDRDGDPREEFNNACDGMHEILKGLMFAQERKVDGSWGYAGDRVQLGDADKPICWWKPEGSETWRVIYGDLSLGDSSERPQP